MATLSRKSKIRRSQIIAELSALSRNGWANAKPYDYEPMEKELARLTAQDSQQTLPRD